MRAYSSHLLGGEPQNSSHGRNLRSLSLTHRPSLRSSQGTRDHQSFSLRSFSTCQTEETTTYHAWHIHMTISRPCTLLQTFVGWGLSRSLSPRRQFRLQLASPKAEYVVPDRKDPRSSGHTCFVLSRAKPAVKRYFCLQLCQVRWHTSNVTLATPKTALAIGFN